MNLRASCLCRGVAFEIAGPVKDMLFCHCSMCRKAHGSAFRARGRIKTDDLRWVRGEDLVKYFESSPGQHRGFCSTCGSNLFTRFTAAPHVLGLALGILDDDPGARPVCHVFVDDKAPWYTIEDSLPRHPGFPPSPGSGSTSMPSLKHLLLQQLSPIEGFSAEPSKVAGGTALFFRGKEFAHFHHDHEIDLRLTRKVIQALGLSHPERSAQHPTRAAGSPWIEVRFHSIDEVHRVVDLVKQAIAQL